MIMSALALNKVRSTFGVVSREWSSVGYALCGGGVLSRASGSDCVGGRRPVAAGLCACSPPPRASCVRFLRTQRSVPECSAIACGQRTRGAGAGAPTNCSALREGYRDCCA